MLPIAKFHRLIGSAACLKRGLALLAPTLASLASPPPASALTVRTMSDLRFWQTVTDRTEGLSWLWHEEADSAVLTFSNRLTRTVSSQTFSRAPLAARGTCAPPAPAPNDEALLAVTLVQTHGGAEVCRETAELAYVAGALPRGDGAAVTAPPITVLTKASPKWRRVGSPRLTPYDASWWHETGPAGYDVMWCDPPGPHRVTRMFEGIGVVDEAVLKFGLTGLLLSLH